MILIRFTSEKSMKEIHLDTMAGCFLTKFKKAVVHT